MKDNIILIGFMGSGKSTTGRQLAKKLSYEFCDTDALIEERAKKKISDIFAENGEEYFRKLETETIEDMLDTVAKTVISPGGGLPLRECNAKILNKLGYVVYLKINKATVLKRLAGDTTRPLLSGDHVEQKIEQLLDYREPLYEIASNLTIIGDHKNVDEIVEEIIHNYKMMMESYQKTNSEKAGDLFETT